MYKRDKDSYGIQKVQPTFLLIARMRLSFVILY